MFAFSIKKALVGRAPTDGDLDLTQGLVGVALSQVSRLCVAMKVERAVWSLGSGLEGQTR